MEFGKDSEGLSLGCVRFEMTSSYPSRDVNYAVGSLYLDFRESSLLEVNI